MASILELEEIAIFHIGTRCRLPADMNQAHQSLARCCQYVQNETSTTALAFPMSYEPEIPTVTMKNLAVFRVIGVSQLGEFCSGG
jgi:hypothetical protein